MRRHPRIMTPIHPLEVRMSGKKPSLGRRLAELSPLLAQRAKLTQPDSIQAVGDRLASLPLDLLQRGKYQPRIDMRAESLEELADSIKSQGVVQPILVRPLKASKPGESQRYEIIAGARRKWPGSRRYPRSFATCPTRRPSRCHSSRTSNARISILSRRRARWRA